MIVQYEDWQKEAACIGKTDIFFGPTNEKTQIRRKREAIAKTICRSCPVLVQCRDYARANPEYGIWGGETEEERHLAGYPIANPLARRKASRSKVKYDL